MSDFAIYSGSCWHYHDKLLAKSIYVEDGELYFDCIWTELDDIGEISDKREIDHVLADLLYSRSQDNKTLIEALELFIDILKKISLGGR